MPLRLAYIVGSLSAHSINRSLARALAARAPEGVECFEAAIGDLPLYNRDFEDHYPEAALRFKDELESADGLLIVTPEYSRSIPGALKNAIDWATRPRGTNSFRGMPTATIGGSPGPISTAPAQQHLKSVLLHLDASVMGQPEGFIHLRPGLIHEDGEVTNESTSEFLASFMKSFASHVQRVRAIESLENIVGDAGRLDEMVARLASEHVARTA